MLLFGHVLSPFHPDSSPQDSHATLTLSSLDSHTTLTLPPRDFYTILNLPPRDSHTGLTLPPRDSSNTLTLPPWDCSATISQSFNPQDSHSALQSVVGPLLTLVQPQENEPFMEND